MPRTIKADGRTITVPDDATPDEINQIVGPAPNTAAPTGTAPSTFGSRLFGNNPVSDVLGTVGTHLKNLVAGPYHAFTDDPRNPEEQSLVQSHGGVNSTPTSVLSPTPHVNPVLSGLNRLGLGMNRMLVQPTEQGIDTFNTQRKTGNTSLTAPEYDENGNYTPTAASGLMDAIPLAGPWARSIENDAHQHGAVAGLAGMGTDLLGAKVGEKAPGAALHPLQTASDIRTAAIGDPDVAGVRAAGVPKKAALGFKSDLQGARPFLSGAQSVEDVQNTAGLGGSARDEIYKPIRDFLSEHGGRTAQGPDGPTTLQALEDERSQTSAQLRQLKAGGPEGIALATQKGLTQADLLARQSALEGAMDPHLMGAGIDSPLIRQTYGQVARVGDQFAGRLTDAEKPTPYGFGRMLNLRIDNPRSWLGSPVQGARDLLAGRPLWSGNAGDVGVRDAFRTGGPKPDFRAPSTSMPPWEEPPLAPPEYLKPAAPYNAPLIPKPRLETQ